MTSLPFRLRAPGLTQSQIEEISSENRGSTQTKFPKNPFEERKKEKDQTSNVAFFISNMPQEYRISSKTSYSRIFLFKSILHIANMLCRAYVLDYAIRSFVAIVFGILLQLAQI